MGVELLNVLCSLDCAVLSLLFFLDCLGSVSLELSQSVLLPLELASFSFDSVHLTSLLFPFVSKISNVRMTF